MKMTKGRFELRNLAQGNASEAILAGEGEEKDGGRKEWVVYNATADRVIPPRGKWEHEEGTFSTKVRTLAHPEILLSCIFCRFGWNISSWESLTTPSTPRFSSRFI